MEYGIWVALVLMLLVGLSLGALGSGGSILMLPILVYLGGFSAAKAYFRITPTSPLRSR
jgi:uncharacterized membrane protein YfcA